VQNVDSVCYLSGTSHTRLIALAINT